MFQIYGTRYMNKICFWILAYVASLSFCFAAEPIEGFWKTINDEGAAQCIIGIYEYEGLCYGRIIATFDDAGKVKDSIYHPKEIAPGVEGDRHYCGLDIIWYLADSGQIFKGQILDPQRGKVYKAELWRDAQDLIVRGKLLMFGRSYTWRPVTDSDLPKDFKLPDLNSFVPNIPQTK